MSQLKLHLMINYFSIKKNERLSFFLLYLKFIIKWLKKINKWRLYYLNFIINLFHIIKNFSESLLQKICSLSLLSKRLIEFLIFFKLQNYHYFYFLQLIKFHNLLVKFIIIVIIYSKIYFVYSFQVTTFIYICFLLKFYKMFFNY